MSSSLKPIRSEADYDLAVTRIAALWGAPDDTDAGDELEALAVLVDAYEKNHWPLADLDPISALTAHMDINGFGQSDLTIVLGSSSRASEILNKKRPLNLAMIRAIHHAWGMPVALLVAEYPLAA